MTTTFLKGFSSQYNELQATPLEVEGIVPAWLDGSLVRNGPGRYDLAKNRLRHWLDGFAMLHRFDFNNGKVCYSNRQLQTKAWTKANKDGEIAYREFASQPHANFLQLLMYMFFPKYSDNAAINVALMDKCHVALNESPHITQYDLNTLDTIGWFKFDDKIRSGYDMSPHPQYDYKNRTLVNFATGMRKINLSGYYNVFRLDDGSRTRQLIAQINSDRPAYMHSFAMTENYVILVEFPVVLENLLTLIFSMKPVIQDYSWLPERGTRFHVISKADGSVRTWQGEAAFGFHQINAFERGNDIIIDIAGYSHMLVLTDLLFESLLQPEGGIVPEGQFRRYTLSANSSNALYEKIIPNAIELPRINYRSKNTHEYRWAYLQAVRNKLDNDFYNQLIKVDVQNREVTGKWEHQHHYPMEPVFVAEPDATEEDQGVVLSVVLDSDIAKSYLLVLDAQTFEWRASIHVPQIVPYGFHGMFYRDNEPMGTVVQ